jgi:hypothetical protein
MKCEVLMRVLVPAWKHTCNIFTCVASQHLILCDITATATTTTPTPTTTTPPRFLKFYLE